MLRNPSLTWLMQVPVSASWRLKAQLRKLLVAPKRKPCKHRNRCPSRRLRMKKSQRLSGRIALIRQRNDFHLIVPCRARLSLRRPDRIDCHQTAQMTLYLWQQRRTCQVGLLQVALVESGQLMFYHLGPIGSRMVTSSSHLEGRLHSALKHNLSALNEAPPTAHLQHAHQYGQLLVILRRTAPIHTILKYSTLKASTRRSSILQARPL